MYTNVKKHTKAYYIFRGNLNLKIAFENEGVLKKRYIKRGEV